MGGCAWRSGELERATLDGDRQGRRVRGPGWSRGWWREAGPEHTCCARRPRACSGRALARVWGPAGRGPGQPRAGGVRAGATSSAPPGETLSAAWWKANFSHRACVRQAQRASLCPAVAIRVRRRRDTRWRCIRAERRSARGQGPGCGLRTGASGPDGHLGESARQPPGCQQTQPRE